MHGATVWDIFANESNIKAHFTGYHGALLQKDWTVQRCKLIQRFGSMGSGEVNADTDILDEEKEEWKWK
jgi:hypothetical protein